MRHVIQVFFAVLSCWASADSAGAQDPGPSFGAGPARTFAWSDEVLDAFGRLPIQDNGRVKPLQTAVQYVLYRALHKRKLYLPDDPRFGVAAGKPMGPVAWSLDTMLYPDWADTFPVFTLEDSSVLAAIGLADAAKRKRDRYSFEELEPQLGTLRERFDEFKVVATKSRTAMQTQVLGLANAVGDYRGLRFFLQFAFETYDMPDDAPIRQLFGGATSLRTSDVLAQGTALVGMLNSGSDAAVRQLLSKTEQAVWSSTMFRLMPPPEGSEDPTWLNVRELFQAAVAGAAQPAQIEVVAGFETFVDAVRQGDEAAMLAAIDGLQQRARALAATQADIAQVDREVSYYNADWFGKAMYLFLFGFITVVLSWLAPRSVWPGRVAFGLTTFGTGLLVTGIVQRCLIRGRPPVTNLYDTILFITAVILIVCLATEWINKKRIALMVGAGLGAIGMPLSFAHEMVEMRDTMDPLVAVLDTNFWLATHVTTVTMGYSAGLLAGAMAYVFLLGKLFGVRKGDRAFYRGLTRMVYGTICFGLLFGTVGTILGGVWANDSWGRFWGWDPKENGALLIVLWFLMTLHARLGGYIRDFGINLMAVLGSAVVGFSWWGVNLLSVGLHSYGFTSGIALALNIFYGVTGTVFVLGLVARALERSRDQRQEPADIEQTSMRDEVADAGAAG